MSRPKLSVSLGLWQDRPPEEALVTARAAERGGFAELWVGESATYDAFALATAIGGVTDRLPLVLGPLPVTVRDPMMIARGTASVAALTGRPTGIALGASSRVVAESWHGRAHTRTARVIEESATAVRALLAGEKVTFDGEVVRTRGYRLRLDPPRSPLTVAAFGPVTIRVAARVADRMVVNLISPAAAGRLRIALDAAAKTAGRPSPRLAAWVPTAVNPDADTIKQLRTGIVGYLAAPGYGQLFRDEGFGSVVDLAISGAHPREVFAAIPDELVTAISALGSVATVREQLAAYAAAGVDEVAVVPSSTPADPAGVRTLTELAALRPAS